MTFQRALMPRNTSDQAIVTGATMSLMYLVASLAHDAIESAASWVLVGGSKRQADDDVLRRVAVAAEVAAFGAGLALQRAFPQRRDEPLQNAAARAGGFWLSASSFAGLASGLTEEIIDTLHERTGGRYHLNKVPIALLGGMTFAAVREFQRRRKEAAQVGEQDENIDLSGARSLAVGTGIGVGLTALLLGNRVLSQAIGRVLGRVMPGDERLWRPLGHAVSLGALSAALYFQWYRITTQIEIGAGKIEAAFDATPKSPFVSGSAESLVPWHSLGREGRRHVSAVLPKLWIEQIMGEPVIDPIRVYVGLDSAPTEEERVNLAIEELRRTGAFNRSLVLVTSPTGTGYVNYVAVESVEYFTKGDCATVTIQYSKRPSPLSLDRVWEGRKHFRLLLAAIRRRLYEMPPEERPRLVIFGESLGAHTSQDAFLHTGTQGLQDAGIERALWIGSPHLSKWKVQVMRSDRPDVEPSLIGEFNSFQDVEAMEPEVRSQLRYFLLTHGNDGVGHFGPDLLIQQPDWLGELDSRPPGVPRSEKWVTPTTFFQTLLDMKNAMNVVPGKFDANGHDYRADLARFVREAYALECSDEQLERVEGALRRYEILRKARMDARPGVEPSPNGDLETAARDKSA
jgi:Alpha/beta-hydrolase family/Alpha/beta-hydrolase family N-terminus